MSFRSLQKEGWLYNNSINLYTFCSIWFFLWTQRKQTKDAKRKILQRWGRHNHWSFPDCRKIKAGILLNLWKLSAWILWITTFWHYDCGNTSIDVSESYKSAWFLVISLIMLQINQYFWNYGCDKSHTFAEESSKIANKVI